MPIFTVKDFLEQLVPGIIGGGIDGVDAHAEHSSWERDLHHMLISMLTRLAVSDSAPDGISTVVLYHLKRVRGMVDAAYTRIRNHDGWQDCAPLASSCACTGFVRLGQKQNWSAWKRVNVATECTR